MAGKKKKKQNGAQMNDAFREQDAKNQTSMLNAAQIDEAVKNPPKKDRTADKRDEIL